MSQLIIRKLRAIKYLIGRIFLEITRFLDENIIAQRIERKLVHIFTKNKIPVWRIPFFSKINKLLVRALPNLAVLFICQRHQEDPLHVRNVIAADHYLHAFFHRQINRRWVVKANTVLLIIKEIYEPVFLTRIYVDLRKQSFDPLADFFFEQLIRVLSDNRYFREDALFNLVYILYSKSEGEVVKNFLEHLPDVVKNKIYLFYGKSLENLSPFVLKETIVGEQSLVNLKNAVCMGGHVVAGEYVMPILQLKTDLRRAFEFREIIQQDAEELVVFKKIDKSEMIDSAIAVSTSRSLISYYALFDSIRRVLFIESHSLMPQVPILISQKMNKKYEKFLCESFPERKFIFGSKGTQFVIKSSYVCIMNEIEDMSESQLRTYKGQLISKVNKLSDRGLKFKGRNYILAPSAERAATLEPFTEILEEEMNFQFVDLTLLSVADSFALFQYANCIVLTAPFQAAYSLVLGHTSICFYCLAPDELEPMSIIINKLAVGASKVSFIPEDSIVEAKIKLVKSRLVLPLNVPKDRSYVSI